MKNLFLEDILLNPWISYGNYHYSNDSFIFALINFQNIEPTKIPPKKSEYNNSRKKSIFLVEALVLVEDMTFVLINLIFKIMILIQNFLFAIMIY